jgi:hypothetical protein
MEVALGYIASAFLAYSLLITNALKFRWLNLTGCLFFIFYGILIEAFPVILANSILFVINLYHLVRLYISKESFEMLPFEEEGILLTKFVEFYKKEISDYFPQFKFEAAKNKISFVVIRDLVIANLFVARITENGDALVEINYTLNQYRDYKIGRFIFEREKEFLISRGVKKIVYENMQNKNHIRFLKVMGFQNNLEKGKHSWVKKLI